MASRVTFDSKVFFFSTQEYSALKEAPIISATDREKLNKLQEDFTRLSVHYELYKPKLKLPQLNDYYHLCNAQFEKANGYRMSSEKRKELAKTKEEISFLEEHLEDLNLLIKKINIVKLDLFIKIQEPSPPA